MRRRLFYTIAAFLVVVASVAGWSQRDTVIKGKAEYRVHVLCDLPETSDLYPRLFEAETLVTKDYVDWVAQDLCGLYGYPTPTNYEVFKIQVPWGSVEYRGPYWIFFYNEVSDHEDRDNLATAKRTADDFIVKLQGHYSGALSEGETRIGSMSQTGSERAITRSYSTTYKVSRNRILIQGSRVHVSTHDGRVIGFSIYLPTLEEDGVQNLQVSPREALQRFADGETDTRSVLGRYYIRPVFKDKYVIRLEPAYYADIAWFQKTREAPLIWVVEWSPQPEGEDTFYDYIVAGELR